MIKISGRVSMTNAEWEKRKKRLGAKTNQDAIENLVRNQLQRWALVDSDLNVRLKRFNDRVPGGTQGQGGKMNPGAFWTAWA